MSLPPDGRFNIEVLKLLLQVAWSDLQLAPEEVEKVMSMGRRWHVSEEDLAPLHERLLQGEPLPAPDLTVLKTRPREVLAAARELVNADGKITMDELDMLTQIRQLLGVPPAGGS